MALKRKFDKDTVSESDRCSKQLRCVPFPSYQADADVAMSDASSDVSLLEPIISEQHHMRLDSDASTSSGSDFGDAPAYPSFSFCPNPFFGLDGSIFVFPTPRKSVGLFEPKNSFLHHGNCTQIPKLRVACASSSHGQRSMWSHCEQCGAIEMIDSDY
ncbi:hypothetical protein B0F90DRAFT_1810269 [Multifurca ochricompacta]|uniref:Uncharacterized protein n=1 Tax=Multifurca ochricompacta TaxID=376703 RepID=A0AAD4QMA7_9AGAM|nr:hypothetical protein B0F90DRAFT_1810269 [Multifurca ochricompacta]